LLLVSRMIFPYGDIVLEERDGVRRTVGLGLNDALIKMAQRF
jgi:hypothetical protein